MLEELRVRDLALIQEAWLQLRPGMTVLTGETGAGKTVLVGALKLLVGERADSTMVAAGADAATVEGRFSTRDGERLARRKVGADGRSRCMLDDEMTTVRGLAEELGGLVDLHGQHEHQALLSPSRHVRYLDRFGGGPLSEALQAYREAFSAKEASRAEVDSLAARLEDRERRLDYLRFQIGEIAAADPSEDEDRTLGALLPGLRHGGRLTEAAAVAHTALTAEGGAEGSIARAIDALSRVSGLDPSVDALAEDLSSAARGLDDVAGRLRERAEAVAHDPKELDSVEARLSQLALLKKKYGPTLADVLRERERAEAEVAELSSAEEGLREAEERLASADDRLQTLGRELASLRRSSAGRFAKMLAEASRDLAMRDASFEVALRDLPPEEWTAEGPQSVEFLYSPGPGQNPRPLARIASGGELSRVMLAIKGVLGEADEVPVLVFDEVDAGIGGSTAHAVGRRLAELARDHQVLVVTHLAQVAACADQHLVVEKRVEGGAIRTLVREVLGEERVSELARMLSGNDTEASRAHARELTSEAKGA